VSQVNQRLTVVAKSRATAYVFYERMCSVTVACVLAKAGARATPLNSPEGKSYQGRHKKSKRFLVCSCFLAPNQKSWHCL